MTAGRLVFYLIYTQAMVWDPPAVRAQKSKISSEGRKKLNFRASWQKLQLLIAANFSKYDLYVTLTYDDAHLPPNRKGADKLASKFLRQLASVRRHAGERLKYVKATHELLDDGGRRLHHHIVINACDVGRDYDLIRSLWSHGVNIDIRPIGGTSYYQRDDFLELSMYLARERDPGRAPVSLGSRSWSCSRGLSKPIRESELVDEGLTVEAPPGAYVLDIDEKRNEYGSFKYIKFLLPERGVSKSGSP